MDKLSSYLMGAQVAVLTVDDQERIVRAERLSPDGWQSNEVIVPGTEIRELFAETPQLADCFKSSLGGSSTSTVVKLGEQRISVHFTPVSDTLDNIKSVSCTFAPGPLQDDTPDSRVPFQKIVEDAIDVVYLTDRHGNFTYVNPPARELTGYAHEELIGMHYSKLIPTAWHTKVSQFYTQQFESRQAETTLEFPILRQDGSELWVEQTARLVFNDNRPTGFQSIARNIHTRKKAERALVESENQYRGLVELSPLPIAVHRDGKLIYVNPAGMQLFGAEELEEITSRPLLSFIHPDYQDLVTERIQKSYTNRQAVPPVVEKMIRLDGTMIEVEVASQPITFQGEPATQVVVKDITKLKRDSTELQQYVDRLEIQYQIDQAILAAQSSQEIAQVVAERMRKLVPCKRVTVSLFDMEVNEVVVIASDIDMHDGVAGEQRFPLHGGYPKNLAGADMRLVEDIETLPDPKDMEKKLLEKGIRTFLNIPLMVREELVGSLNLGAAEPGHFTPEYIQIAQELAGSLAVAIEQARLYEEVNLHASQLEQRISDLNDNERYLELLNEITRTSISVDNLETLLKTLEDSLGELFTADACRIILAEGDPREGIPGTPENESLFATRPLTFLHNEAEPSNNSGGTIYWSDEKSEGTIAQTDNLPDSISYLSLPLVAGEQKLGAALIAYKVPRPMTAEDIRRGEQVAGQIALAVAKTSLLDSERRRRKEAETLRTVSNALASTLDLQQVLDIVLEQLAVVIKYDSAAILLWEDDVVKAVAGHGFRDYSLAFGEEFPMANWLFDEIRRTMTPFWLTNPHKDPRFLGWGNTKDIRSWMGLPLIVHGKLIGFMTLDSYDENAYGEGPAALVQPFANQAAQAIENASLFDWVQRQAVTDALTDVYNRRGFFDLGQREVDRALRFNRELIAVMLDIDLFKQVNDRVGHATGDQVLSEIAKRCVQVLRRVDLIGRYGGEEFAILLPETNLESAESIAERLRETIAETPISTDKGPIPVTISLGVASVNPAVRDLASLLDAADTAMYAAKQAGRNCVKIFQWES